MRLTLKGDTELFTRLDKLDDVMKRSFWIGVQEDYEKNLLQNIKPYHDTGRLERNAYVDIIKNGVEGGIRDNGMMVNWRGAQVNYGIFIEYGTRDHMIQPSKKKALRFISGGQFAFSKGHMVSGIKAAHFLERSAKKTFSNLDRIFNKELQDKGIL